MEFQNILFFQEVHLMNQAMILNVLDKTTMIITMTITGSLLYVADNPLANIALPETVAQGCSVKKVFLETSQNSTGKHFFQSLFFNKITDLRPATLLKKGLWHSWIPVNFAKFLQTRFLTEHLWWLLLSFLDDAVEPWSTEERCYDIMSHDILKYSVKTHFS